MRPMQRKEKNKIGINWRGVEKDPSATHTDIGGEALEVPGVYAEEKNLNYTKQKKGGIPIKI